MIGAGKYICPTCGNTMSRAFYMNETYGAGVLLVRNRFQKYVLEPCIPGSNAVDKAREEVDFVLTDQNDLTDGMPDKIWVQDRKDGQRKKVMVLQHCCPACTDELGKPLVMKFPPSFGAIPTYFIAVVGAKESGKGSWLDAITSMNNQNNLQGAGFSCRIDPYQVVGGREVITKTNLASPGNTKYLYLAKNERPDQPYAMVILRDFAGELFDDEANLNKAAGVNMLGMLERLDAILFLTDESTEEGQDARKDTFNWLKKYLSKKNGEPVIMGVVLTHADIMLEEGRMTEKNPDIPLLTPHTFLPDSPDSYRLNRLMQRIELEDMIARQYSKAVNVMNAEKCFIVKSATPRDKTDEDEDEEENDFSNGINIYDPLLWVLNRLRLFPLT